MSLYDQAAEQPGYNTTRLMIAESACNRGYATGSAVTRDDVYWEAAAEAKRQYAKLHYGVAFMPLGLWLVMTAAGAFMSWFIQRRLDEWFNETGAPGCSD